MNDRDVLMGLASRQYKEVAIQLPNGSTHTFRLQSLTFEERAKYQRSMWDEKKNAPADLVEMQARLLTATLVDADGSPLFKPSERRNFYALDGGVLGELYDAAMEFVRIGRRAVSDAVGNSEETDTEDSSSEQ